MCDYCSENRERLGTGRFFSLYTWEKKSEKYASPISVKLES